MTSCYNNVYNIFSSLNVTLYMHTVYFGEMNFRSSLDPVPPFFGCRRHLELVGKVALITGGTSGIGLAVANDLIENGVRRVIVAGRDVQAGARVLQHLNDLCDGADQEAVYVPTDVTSVDDLKGMQKSTKVGFTTNMLKIY